jgi:hypothetical protein
MIKKSNKNYQMKKTIKQTNNIQERFTDEYSEYFEDDENKADRFTDDYHETFTD